jgi:hypothetical protein
MICNSIKFTKKTCLSKIVRSEEAKLYFSESPKLKRLSSTKMDSATGSPVTFLDVLSRLDTLVNHSRIMHQDLKIVRQDLEALDRDVTRLSHESSATFDQIRNFAAANCDSPIKEATLKDELEQFWKETTESQSSFTLEQK